MVPASTPAGHAAHRLQQRQAAGCQAPAAHPAPPHPAPRHLAVKFASFCSLWKVSWLATAVWTARCHSDIQLQLASSHSARSDLPAAAAAACLQALEAILQTTGRLPVNVKLLLEGAGEVGSPDMAKFLTRFKDILQADLALSTDGAQINDVVYTIPTGFR